MHVQIISHQNYDTIALSGAITLRSLPKLTPQLSTHLSRNVQKDYILDLTDITSIDSSIIRLFLNLKKRLEKNNRELYLLKPPQEIDSLLSSVNFSAIVKLISHPDELQQTIDETQYRKYLPFTTEDNNMKRLRCTCEICGSQAVFGYLLDQNAFRWNWERESYFPFCEDLNGNPFDYFSALPIVCMDCFTSSLEISHFNIIDESGTVQFTSVLDEKTKILLSKSTKRRKKLMELNIAVGDNFFLFPRSRIASYYAYLLAETCARTVTTNQTGLDSFTIGYMNYLALQYAEDEKKGESINNCRTWLNQALNERHSYDHTQLSQLYFILMIALISLEKHKEAARIYQEYEKMMEKMPVSNESGSALNSLHFWFKKAEMVWQDELQKKSYPVKST